MALKLYNSLNDDLNVDHLDLKLGVREFSNTTKVVRSHKNRDFNICYSKVF